MKRSLLISIIVVTECAQFCGGQSSAKAAPGIVYSNPRVYNVDYSFEMTPDPNKIDRAKDLKVWIPIPREWDSQKAVQIISIQPEPHARYVDPEYGNPMLFWDFGKEPEQPSCKVDIKFRLESYDISVEVDPNRIGSYDKTSEEYVLYTRSTHTIHITPKIRELAQEAIGDETNPYLQAKRIIEFVKKKMNYKILDFERGRGIDVLLAHPVVDKETGQEHYEGCCSQFTALAVALCRAVGIPARCVAGYIGWSPWVNKDGLKAKYPFETKLSPDGLAGTQLYGGLGSHMWGEFFIPNYGWIPADPTSGMMGHRDNQRWIKWKGRDIPIGSHAPQENSEGYGAQWVALHDGRTDSFFYAALNIAKIRTSKVTVLHHSDPFPADGLAGYSGNSPASEEAERNLMQWRQWALSWPSYRLRSFVSENLNSDQFYKDNPRAKADREAFVCHMLRRQLGDEQFSRLVKTYLGLRQESGRAIPTSRFQKLAEDIYGEPLDWFFNQWVNNTELPRLKLENVTVRKNKENWQIRGRLLQSGDTTFQLPIELAIDTKDDREKRKLRMDGKSVEFDFHTLSEPKKLIVDPDYDVLKVQKTAPRFWWYWEDYPKMIVVYGTLKETKANKTTAEQFNSNYLGLGSEIVKADTDVNDTDMKTKCVFLVGRPETNKIARQFKNNFPIKFDGDGFTWQGTTYKKPTQGVTQIVENPNNAQGLMIMYAGLSPEATLKMHDLESYDSDSSYVIFDGDKQVAAGDWEDADSNLYWNFDTDPTTQ